MNIRKPHEASRFTVVGICHKGGANSRDEGLLVYKSFVFEPDTTIKQVFEAIYDQDDAMLRFQGQTLPIQLILTVDQNSLPSAFDEGQA